VPEFAIKSGRTTARPDTPEVEWYRPFPAAVLEISMADAAAQAVANVELLLSVEASERSVMIDNQLRVFETYEHGLLD
jgi:hypothetical protein